MADPSLAESTFVLNPSSPPPTSVQGVPDSQVPFLAKDEIEDLAVRLAMSGLSLEDGLLHLENARKINLEALEEECVSRKTLLAKWISQLNESIEAYKQQSLNLREKQGALRQKQFSIDVAIQTLHLKKATLRLEMRVKQLEHEKQFFDVESKRLGEKQEQIQDKIAHEKEDELEYAKRLHSSLLEVWKIDEEELLRRAEVLKNEESRTDDLLKHVGERIKHLRDAGISRTTAGFLVWVGYTAFAGVGSVVGGLLQRRQADPRNADLLGNFIRGFASLFGLSQGSVFSWAPFWRLIGFVGLALGIIATVTVLSDLLLRKFNPKWKENTERRERRNRVGKTARGWKDVVALLTTGSDRLSLFTGKINRADYTQLLAISPYLVLAGVIVFLISALGLTIPLGSAGPSASAPATLMAASIGAIFVLLSTSACLLYATKVIEPRWARSIKLAEDGSESWKYIKLNWEFGLLLGIMIVVVLILTFMPLGEPNDYRVWGLAALFMTMGSIGLAYGLIYRGIFRDHDVLARSRQEYLVKIEEFILKPTLNDVFESTEPDDLKDSAEKYRKAMEYLDGLRVENELSGLFADEHPDYDSDFSRFWFTDDEKYRSRDDVLNWSRRPGRKLSRLIRRLGWRKRIADSPQAWWRVAPEEREEYKAHEDQIALYEQQLKEIGNQLLQLEGERITTESRASTARQELRDNEVRLWTVQTNCAGKLRNHNLQKQRDEIAFTAAFLTGRMVYEYLAVDRRDSISPEGVKL